MRIRYLITIIAILILFLIRDQYAVARFSFLFKFL